MNGVVLAVEHLVRRFGEVTAIGGVSFEVTGGEIFGLLGPNGAGKTTTIRVICGELAADEGRVLLHGRPISTGPADRVRVGVCPQEIVIWRTLTCLEQLEFVGRMYGLPARRMRESARRLLADLDLEQKAGTRGDALSGGMQRRLNIALALVHDPELVILDEPSAGLDPQNRVRVRDFVRSLARHRTVLLTTHDMDEADRLCDRVAVIDHGELLACDRPETLKQRQGGEVIELRFLDSDEEAAAKALAGLADDGPDRPDAGSDRSDGGCGISVQRAPGLLTVTAAHATQALPRILERLEHGNARADEVRLRMPSLEDVFLGLTGRSLRQ